MRTLPIGDLRFVSTPIEPGPSTVRMFRGDRTRYFEILITTPRDDGRGVDLSNHLSIAETLSVRNWLTGAAEFYPDAGFVDLERMERDGTLTKHSIRL